MTIIVKNLAKNLDGTELYKNLSFEAKTGKITAIFGPNGSGKSTLFNIIAGISKPDEGECIIQPFGIKHFSYMFQNYRDSLLPWRTNWDNIALPLQTRKLTQSAISRRIKALKKQLGIDIPLDNYPYELSGGQQQMLAFFRTLIMHPNTLLLDEPFSALDYENSIKQRNCLQDYHGTYKPTILIITHDIEEAVYLAEEIIIFSNKPTRIAGVINNPLPYPRTIETLKTKTFHDVKNAVLKLFQQEVEL